MKLSDAIALGRTLVCPLRCGSTHPTAKSGDGCVLDMAVVAVRGTGTWQQAHEIWPWLLQYFEQPNGLREMYFWEIIRRFDGQVMLFKTMTLDQLIDYVASVEPQEPEQIAAPRDPAEAIQREVVHTRAQLEYSERMEEKSLQLRCTTGPECGQQPATDQDFDRAEADWLERPV